MVVKLNMNPPSAIMKRLGIDARGKVQRFHTQNVLRRIVKYMPYRTGATIKLTQAQSPVSEPYINTHTDYARRLYLGVSATGKPLNYTKDKNPLAGPFWDRALVAAEGAQMRAELQSYIRRL